MDMVERNAGRSGRPLLKWVAAGSAALFLVSSAYQASWGQGVGEDYDDDEGLSAGEIAAITVGGLAAGYGLWLLLGKDDDDDEETQKAKAPALKDGAAVSALRLVPSQKSVGAGERVVFDLQAKTVDGWATVTERDGAAIEVKGGGLERLDGSKNAFALPITASAAGEKVSVEGRFNGLATQTTLQLAN